MFRKYLKLFEYNSTTSRATDSRVRIVLYVFFLLNARTYQKLPPCSPGTKRSTILVPLIGVSLSLEGSTMHVYAFD